MKFSPRHLVATVFCTLAFIPMTLILSTLDFFDGADGDYIVANWRADYQYLCELWKDVWHASH